MTRLLYIANVRLPTEKAHGLQIMQNCEAFADAGTHVTLWTAMRKNRRELRGINDIWTHYGVKRNFERISLPTLDLLLLVPSVGLLARLAFHVQQTTFVLAVLLRAAFVRADVYYSRDAITLLVLSLIKPRRALVYEAHTMPATGGGRWLRRLTLRRCEAVVAVTRRLGDDLIRLGAEAERVHVAHDGIRAERFAELPSQADARVQLGWPKEAFIVGYVGRLQTMAQDKGVGLLIEALRTVEGATLALVGGPDDLADQFGQAWRAGGLAAERFINAGQVSPDRVPLYLAALDVCAMPFPWTEHFAYYASPMKLFEYMASGRAIVASDLPSTAEVVSDGETALLYPPGDAAALSAAICRLRDDTALRDRLGQAARETVMLHYTWAARAGFILGHLQEGDHHA
ncbi:MAG: glycosyltransferase family 4 protein [Anaerolineae bacterium]|nr:glycosyltransferase family 4 protein [Anaerolineae bacterium]